VCQTPLSTKHSNDRITSDCRYRTRKLSSRLMKPKNRTLAAPGMEDREWEKHLIWSFMNLIQKARCMEVLCEARKVLGLRAALLQASASARSRTLTGSANTVSLED